MTQGKLRLPVAVQRFMNVRIMLPTTPELFFPYHTGLLYGHGIASRSIWMPFVDVTADEDRSRSMQIIGIKRSRELIKHAIDQRLSMEQMTELFDKESWQIKAGPGSGCFFTQENIHGSGRPNTTGKTRVSMDFRIAEGIYGDLLGRKIPAGYFHLIPETEEEEEALAARPPREKVFNNGKSNIFYVANNTAATYRYRCTCSATCWWITARRTTSTSTRNCSTSRICCTCRRCGISSTIANATSSCTASLRCRRMRTIATRCLRPRSSRADHPFRQRGFALADAEDLKEIKKYLEFSKYGQSRLPIGLPLSELSKAYFDKWAASLAQSRGRKQVQRRSKAPLRFAASFSLPRLKPDVEPCPPAAEPHSPGISVLDCARCRCFPTPAISS